MTTLPTTATADHLRRQLDIAETAVAEACRAYNAGRITARSFRETREYRDEIKARHAETLRASMLRTVEGREELDAAARVFGA